jgi:hypothetical protein
MPKIKITFAGILEFEVSWKIFGAQKRGNLLKKDAGRQFYRSIGDGRLAVVFYSARWVSRSRRLLVGERRVFGRRPKEREHFCGEKEKGRESKRVESRRSQQQQQLSVAVAEEDKKRLTCNKKRTRRE